MPRRIGLLLLCVAVLVASPAEAAIAQVGTCGGDSTATGSVTTATCTPIDSSGTNDVAYCAAMANDNPVVSPDPTVIWDDGGPNEQDFGSPIKVSSGTGLYLAVYRLTNPAGTGITVSFSGLSGSVRDAVACVVYSGVDQTTPNDTVDLAETAAANALSSGTITSPAGDWIVGFLAGPPSTATVVVDTASGNSLEFEQFVAGNNGRVSIAEDADGADDTIDWSYTGSNSKMSAITFNLNAASAAGSGGSRRSLVGFGR